MNFLLKIVEGPNKGAEIALVEGVPVTLGKSDACDIVLADATMGDEPMKLEVSAGGLSLDGERLEPLHVARRGSTAFAAGPADAAWGELVWPEDAAKAAEPAGDGEARKAESAEAEEREPQAEEREPEAGKDCGGSGKRRLGCACLVALAVLLFALAAVLWLFGGASSTRGGGGADGEGAGRPGALATLVERYGLVETNRDGRAVLVGDFRTRAERLAATAEAYAAQPGVELDFADSESLKAAVADTLALVGERRLAVVEVTNRVAVLSGGAADIRRALEAIAADVPKVANVDMAGVATSGGFAGPGSADMRLVAESMESAEPLKPVRAMPPLPVCGILTAPYPCLVLRDGRRVLEGAPVGDSVVLKIEPDSVTLTNATGRFTWKP